jgi:hypothetical protein
MSGSGKPGADADSYIDEESPGYGQPADKIMQPSAIRIK